MKVLKWIRDLYSASARHPVGLLGSAIGSVAGALIATILLLDFLGMHTNPYVGVLTYMILPGVLVFGFALVPVGVVLDRRRRAAGGGASAFPVIDLNRETHRSRFLGFSVLVLVNLVILGTVSYRGVEYMDSVQFCGQTCHSVMAPEYTAYRRSPHARVACVSCHIGPGAGWFVKSKLSGLGQVFAVTFNTYERPIPTPVRNLRPARETCEQCHWPEKIHGDRIKVKTTYREDEKNTELKTALILKVGGGSPDSGFASGIHWHMNIANRVTYMPTDESRQTIPYIRFEDRTGQVTEYVATGTQRPTEDDLRAGGRTMDCVDCHNRPTHIYRRPEREVDDAIRAGFIDRGLPFIRKVGLETISRPYDTSLQAEQSIPVLVDDYYRKNYPALVGPKSTAIRDAGKALAAAYAANVFPEMKISWGAYPNNLGHMDSPGCFRCHDGEHKSADGRVISNECETCHTVLAVEEENPEVLKTLFPN
ncbi:MAG: NapC/NirT family cytochrome c [Acidobacteria bacterium]|nr:NapC/NirT family cytochrome c [Acidobacteriota bacterium]